MSELPKGCSNGEQHLQVLFKTHDFFSSEVSFYSYRGTMLEHFTTAILELGEHVKKGNGQEKLTIKKRAPFIMLECFQNILRHGVQEGSGEARGYFGFYSSPEFFTINTINEIDDNSIESLSNLLDDINQSSDEQKKLRYLEIMQNENFGEEGGAGLGLIEISRKSGSKLEYEMESKHNGRSSFHQQVTILFNESKYLPPQIQFTKMMEDWMSEHQLHLVYRGDLDAKSIQPIVDMMTSVEGKEEWENLDKMLRSLQNIQNSLFNTDAHRGIILLGKSEGRFYVQVGIEVENKEKESLCALARLQFKAQAWKSPHPFRPFAACVARPMDDGKELFSFQMTP
jgi:hypothetical protein